MTDRPLKSAVVVAMSALMTLGAAPAPVQAIRAAPGPPTGQAAP